MKLKYQMRGLGIGIMVTALLMGVATGKGIPLSDAEIKAKALELGMVEREALKLTDLKDGASSPEGTASQDKEGVAVSDGSGVEDAEGPDSSSGANGTDGADTPLGADGAGSPDAASEPDGGESKLDSAPGPSEGEGEPDAMSGAGEGEGEPDSAPGPGDGAGETGTAAGEEGSDEPGGASDGDGFTGTDTLPEQADPVTVVIEFGVTSSRVSEILEEAGLVEDAAAFDDYLCSNGYSRKITAGVYEIRPGTSEEELVAIITKNR